MRIEGRGGGWRANPAAGRALVPVAAGAATADGGRERDRSGAGRFAPGMARFATLIAAQIIAGRDGRPEPRPRRDMRRGGRAAEAARAYGEALRAPDRLPAGTMLSRSF